MIPGSLSDRPLLDAIKAEIVHLEEEGVQAKADGYFEQAVIYDVAAMRLRVMLQRMGFAEPSNLVFENLDKVGQIAMLQAKPTELSA